MQLAARDEDIARRALHDTCADRAEHNALQTGQRPGAYDDEVGISSVSHEHFGRVAALEERPSWNSGFCKQRVGLIQVLPALPELERVAVHGDRDATARIRFGHRDHGDLPASSDIDGTPEGVFRFFRAVVADDDLAQAGGRHIRRWWGQTRMHAIGCALHPTGDAGAGAYPS